MANLSGVPPMGSSSLALNSKSSALLNFIAFVRIVQFYFEFNITKDERISSSLHILVRHFIPRKILIQPDEKNQGHFKSHACRINPFYFGNMDLCSKPSAQTKRFRKVNRTRKECRCLLRWLRYSPYLCRR